MNKRIIRKAALAMTLGIGMLFAPPARAQVPGAAPRISEAEVVSIATVHNPGLRSAMLEYQSAHWSVVAEEARFAFVLQLDGGLTFNRSSIEMRGVPTGSHAHSF